MKFSHILEPTLTGAQLMVDDQTKNISDPHHLNIPQAVTGYI
jgi:hypothetical protein